MRGFFYLIHFFLFHKFLVLFFCFTPLFTVSGQNRQVNDLFLKAEILFKEKKFIEAEKVYAEIGKNYQQLSLEQQQLFFLHWGKGIYWKGDRTNALTTVQKVLKIDYPIASTSLYEYYWLIGAIYRESGILDSAIVNLKKAENIKVNHHLQKYQAQFILSQIYTDQANYPLALSNCLGALKIAQDLKETTNVPAILIEVARINSFLRRFDDAKNIYLKCIDYQKKHGVSLHLSTSYQGIATVFYDEKQYDKAIYYLNEALKCDLKEGNDYNLIYVYENLAESYNYLNNTQKAIYYHRLAQEKLDKVGTIQDKIIISTNAASMFLNTNNYELANQKALYALKLAQKHQMTFNYLELLKILSIISSEKGQYKEAYLYSKTYNILKDSVENVEKEKINQTLLKKYQLSEKEREIGEQKLLLVQQENETQRWIVIALLAILLCFVFLALFWVYKNRYQRRLGQTLGAVYEKVNVLQNELGIADAMSGNELKISNPVVQVVQSLSRLETQMIERFKTNNSFNYLISHELRNNLKHIQNGLNMAANESNTIGKSAIKQAIQNINKLDMLTIRLLDLTKIEKSTLFLASCDLEQLIQEVIEESINVPQNCSIVIQKMPTLSIDRLLFKQVFENLITNAIKFSSQQTTIQIVVSSEIKENDIAIKVTDNGVGFPPQLQNNLFKPFHRLQTQIKGEGIGLVIIKTIVEKHKGKVFAYNNTSVGATFGFSLPINASV